MAKYRYFVAFMCREGTDGYRYGNCDFETTKPIGSYEDIQRIQQYLACRGNWHSVIVISWREWE